ncbi:hypothetical protein IFM89_005583 [Coptis chinensis]|uniref:hAT-like transposase RNase-H fold domain-containing protein n=1 Tax=Coptis chinensis TaxID=261450 RepID=A0A835M3X9_9MAGN|nr:hypothetical protein IFM89_005583 [Coptis chinensis]
MAGDDCQNSQANLLGGTSHLRRHAESCVIRTSTEKGQTIIGRTENGVVYSFKFNQIIARRETVRYFVVEELPFVKEYANTPTLADWKNAVAIRDLFKVYQDATKLFSGSREPAFKPMYTSMRKKYDRYWKDVPLVLGLASCMDPRYKFTILELCVDLNYESEPQVVPNSELTFNQLKMKTYKTKLTELFEEYEKKMGNIEFGLNHRVPNFGDDDDILSFNSSSTGHLKNTELRKSLVIFMLGEPNGAFLQFQCVLLTNFFYYKSVSLSKPSDNFVEAHPVVSQQHQIVADEASVSLLSDLSPIEEQQSSEIKLEGGVWIGNIATIRQNYESSETSLRLSSLPIGSLEDPKTMVTFGDPKAAKKACLDPSPGRRANWNLASLGRPHPPSPYGNLISSLFRDY